MKNVFLLVLTGLFLFSFTPKKEEKETLESNKVNLSSAAPHAVFVFTNHGEMGATGEKSGYWLAEAAHSWKILSDAGFQITFASPKGGISPVTPRSLNTNDPRDLAFLNGPVKKGEIDQTVPLSDINLNDVDVLFFVGGYGVMWDYPSNPIISEAILTVDKNKGILAGICHGPAAFVGVMDENGIPFIKNKLITSFTSNEEIALKREYVVPFILETRLRELGANFVPGENFGENVQIDGRLITGQNPASGEKMANSIIKILNEPN